MEAPPFKLKRTRETRFIKGLKYEQTALDYLSEYFGKAFIQKPWFCYQAAYRPYPCYCQVDGLLVTEKVLAIFEVKWSHTADSYYQMENIYRPVSAKVFPGREWLACEVVKWFDPAVAYPVEIQLVQDLKQLPVEKFSAHIYNPRPRKVGK